MLNEKGSYGIPEEFEDIFTEVHDACVALEDEYFQKYAQQVPDDIMLDYVICRAIASANKSHKKNIQVRKDMKNGKYNYRPINENMKKQTIKINESQLRDMIKESIKKVLKENNTNTINALSTEIGCSPQNIYRDETHPYRYFVKGMDGDRDVEYLVFDNEEQAKEYALHIFDAEGAAPLDYYIQNAKLAGANMEILFPNGKPNWKEIKKFIVDTCGPEWVLAGYDGEPIALENGQIAYRWD